MELRADCCMPCQQCDRSSAAVAAERLQTRRCWSGCRTRARQRCFSRSAHGWHTRLAFASPPLSLRQRLSCCRDCLQLQFGHVRQTLTSMVENQCSVGDRNVPLIDVPGHPRLRESIRGKYAKQAKRVVFVIDSKEFKDTSRETAEYVATCARPLQQHRKRACISPGTESDRVAYG